MAEDFWGSPAWRPRDLTSANDLQMPRGDIPIMVVCRQMPSRVQLSLLLVSQFLVAIPAGKRDDFIAQSPPASSPHHGTFRMNAFERRGSVRRIHTDLIQSASPSLYFNSSTSPLFIFIQNSSSHPSIHPSDFLMRKSPPNFHRWLTFSITALLSPVILYGHVISYRCEGDQVLIVQSFGNDTIRMHCQRLNLCGNKKLTCHYERAQPSCGGKGNFVAHVTQRHSDAPVEHTCCEYVRALSSTEHEAPSFGDVPGHEGNDCFVYELPDGTDKQTKALDEGIEQFTVLNNVDQMPVQLSGDQHGQVGYRLRLFLLRSKSPPVLLVKGIHRAKEGFRVTICRPRCGKLDEVQADKKKMGLEPKLMVPNWAAAAWSSWTSTTWTSWSTTTWNGTRLKGRGRTRADRLRGGEEKKEDAERKLNTGKEREAEEEQGKKRKAEKDVDPKEAEPVTKQKQPEESKTKMILVPEKMEMMKKPERMEPEERQTEEAGRVTNLKKPVEIKTEMILVPEKMEMKKRPERMEPEERQTEEAGRVTNLKKPEEEKVKPR
uniref:Uncharacterized protein n=1 Tax=Globodera rostochiensis TaxID=31243 RepID=A0A914HEC9_GLORO